MMSNISMSISIHALRAEGDYPSTMCLAVIVISIHALRAEGDMFEDGVANQLLDFNPRPPCGGRPMNNEALFKSRCISIHALRAEGDSGRQTFNEPSRNFNPRPPCGGRRNWFERGRAAENFNPRPPCGGRPYLTSCASKAS